MMSDGINEEALAQLRVPFPASAIGKLPRVTCRACKEKKCQTHKNQKCNTCKQWISTAHIHLDYVGHAALTDRLLNVDPTWTWAPVAVEDDGRPKLDRNSNGHPVGLWIALTVAGMTRLGYGSVDPGKGDAVKELIGDALRNAGMRFGMALDLWSKEDLPGAETDGAGDPDGEAGTPAPSNPPAASGGRTCERCGEPLGGAVKRGDGGGYVHKNGCDAKAAPDTTAEESTGAPDGTGDEAAAEVTPRPEQEPAAGTERVCPLCHDPLTGSVKKVDGEYAHKACAEKQEANA